MTDRLDVAASPSAAMLPRPLTPLVGRERERAAVGDLLAAEDVRLVTLTGPGGVGKTRLAVAVGGEVASHFRNGVVFVPLGGVTDPTLVASAIAQAADLRPAAGRTVLRHLGDELRDQELLLILDNFEHLLAAAPLVADLLAGAPGLKVLITSQSRLRVRGEHDYAVPPLALPPATAGTDPVGLAACDAVRLFVSRAMEIDTRFVLTAANGGTVAAICRRVDGLPLAIELAAARLRLLTPAELLTRLEDRFPLLTGGPRDLPARQRTLHDTIAWSYDLLSPTEQTLFRRLAVFVDDFGLEAVDGAHAIGAVGSMAILDGLASLIDKSLLRRIDADRADDPTRFAMLESIRAFGQDRLAESDEDERVRGDHARTFLALAEGAESRLFGPDQAVWLDRLARDHGNLRAALSWFRDHDQSEAAARLAGAIWLFWLIRGHLFEGRRLIGSLLAAPDLDEATRTKLLTGAGALAEATGDWDDAATLLDDALTRARALGNPRGLATALLFRSLLAFDQLEFNRSVALGEECLAVAATLDDRWTRAVALAQLALVVVRTKDHNRAEALLTESLDLFRALDNRWGVALATGTLGIIALDRNQPARAAMLLADSLRVFRGLGDDWGVGTYLEGAARVARVLHAPERAARLFGAAEAISVRIGAPLKPAFRGGHTEHLESIRATLGDDAFGDALAAGRAMTAEQAVDLAFENVATPTSTTRTATSDLPFPLTGRERDVLRRLTEGLSDKEIGDQLFIGHRTVATHVTNIFTKLGTVNRTATAAHAVRHGLV